MTNWLGKLQSIDRRIMYLLLIVMIGVPLLWDFMRQELSIGTEIRGVYDTVERVPDGKIAIMSIVWGAGTLGENRPQTEVIARHLFRQGVPFVVIPWDQQGTTLSYGTIELVAQEMGKEYGKDWISTGFRVPYIAQFLQSLVWDIPGTIGNDIHGRPVDSYPLMEGIKTAEDIGMVVEITPSATLDNWIAFIGQPRRVPIVYAPTAVMVPEGYNYLDTRQIRGMLPGLIGAAKYEQLMEHRGFASRAANALSTSHLMIIILIILGNLGYYISRRQQQ